LLGQPTNQGDSVPLAEELVKANTGPARTVMKSRKLLPKALKEGK
jgi:hypothetical protein